MSVLIVVLYLIASMLLFGMAWVGRQAGFMPLILALGAFHVAIGILIVRRIYGRQTR